MSAPGPQKPDLSTHPLLDTVQGNSQLPPNVPPNVVVLTGYFGPTQKPDSIRLYPSLDFQLYFEIPQDAIVATTKVDPDSDLSPTLVHVKAGTPVELVQRSTQPIEAYLQGGITAEYMQAATTGGQPWGGGQGAPNLLASRCSMCNCPSPALAAAVLASRCSMCNCPSPALAAQVLASRCSICNCPSV
jgi:hypothetical protein